MVNKKSIKKQVIEKQNKTNKYLNVKFEHLLPVLIYFHHKYDITCQNQFYLILQGKNQNKDYIKHNYLLNIWLSIIHKRIDLFFVLSFFCF